jgi:hypothetical protein
VVPEGLNALADALALWTAGAAAFTDALHDPAERDSND